MANRNRSTKAPDLSLNDILKFEQDKIEDSIFYTQNDNMLGSQILIASQDQKDKKDDDQEKVRYVQIKRR